jgi:hypothetical protein
MNEKKEFSIQMSSLSDLLINEKSDILYKQKHLKTSRLDFSIKSLQFINKYLSKIRKDQMTDTDLSKIYIRCGVYLGDVILLNSNENADWIEFDEAVKLNQRISYFGKSLETFALLNFKEQFWFPINKIGKFLTNGQEDDLEFFAIVVIEQIEKDS